MVNVRVPQGVKDYLLALAEVHGAKNTRKKQQKPSIQVLLRMIASENIKTLKCHAIAEVDAEPYPFSK